jgi:zinc protease
MKRAALALCTIVGAVVFAFSVRAAETPVPIAPPKINIPFEKYQLENGLEVLLHRDSTLPLVAINVWYHVGPVNEPPGRSGFAHLFEHLMFEGSRHVGKHFDQVLESAGATNANGTTSWDRTNYFETVPREQLELVLWLESDRMGFMIDNITQERLDVQRNVVMNERRQSYENAPYGKSTLTLLNALFPPGHPYHGAIIGSMADLQAATLEDVRNFFRDFYAPSNATLALAGDFQPGEAHALIERYFGPLRHQPRPGAGDATRSKPGPRVGRMEVVEPVDLAQISFGWLAPPAYSPQDPVLDVATSLLAGGKATRLYRELVVEQQLASDVSAWADPNALGTIVVVSATVATGRPVSEVEDALGSCLAKLATTPPTQDELQRAKRGLLVGLYDQLQLLNGHGGESGRAGLLQRFNHYLGSPAALEDWPARLTSVTADDVKTVVEQYLRPDQRVTVVTLPGKKQGEGQ